MLITLWATSQPLLCEALGWLHASRARQPCSKHAGAVELLYIQVVDILARNRCSQSVAGLNASLMRVYLCLVANQESNLSVHACRAQVLSARLVYDASVSAGKLSAKIHPARHLQ